MDDLAAVCPGHEQQAVEHGAFGGDADPSSFDRRDDFANELASVSLGEDITVGDAVRCVLRTMVSTGRQRKSQTYCDTPERDSIVGIGVLGPSLRKR